MILKRSTSILTLIIALTPVIATVVRPMNKVSKMDTATGGMAV